MRSGKISASEDGAVHLDTTQIEPGEISPGQICRREIRAMAFAIFRLEVEPVRSQYLLDLLGGENANRCPRREIGHTSEGRSRPIRIRHAAILPRKHGGCMGRLEVRDQGWNLRFASHGDASAPIAARDVPFVTPAR